MATTTTTSWIVAFHLVNPDDEEAQLRAGRVALHEYLTVTRHHWQWTVESGGLTATDATQLGAVLHWLHLRLTGTALA